MLQTKDAHKLKVFAVSKKGKTRKYGRVRNVIFHPSKPQAVGLIVKRPDLLWMIKRKDRFVALDKVSYLEDGNVVVELADNEAWDSAACKRLGFDLDDCIIWDNMSVRNLQGADLGAISNIVLDDDLRIASVDVSSGGINRAILGSADIVASRLRGYDPAAQAIVADVDPDDVVVSGGVAAKAGEAWAKGSHKVAQGQEAVSERAAQNIEDSAYAAGEAIASVKEKAQAKLKESGASDKASQLGAKAQDAVNDGAYKLGRAIGNLKRQGQEPLEASNVEVKTSAASDGSAATASTSDANANANAKAQAKAQDADEDDFDAAAKAVGAHLKKAGGMFSAFKEEFDKASK